MGKSGRPMKYTAPELNDAVERYFRTISRTEVITERVTVMIDGMPEEHVEEVRNDEGEPAMRTRWLKHPSISGLCLALKIDPKTWDNYADEKKNPRHAPVCAWAKLVCKCYLEELMCTKEKSVQGVIFNYTVNYLNREKEEAANAQSASAIEGMSMKEKLALIRRAAGVSENGEDKPDDPS